MLSMNFKHDNEILGFWKHSVHFRFLVWSKLTSSDNIWIYLVFLGHIPSFLLWSPHLEVVPSSKLPSRSQGGGRVRRCHRPQALPMVCIGVKISCGHSRKRHSRTRERRGKQQTKTAQPWKSLTGVGKSLGSLATLTIQTLHNLHIQYTKEKMIDPPISVTRPRLLPIENKKTYWHSLQTNA
jgi:hypothetical protein